MRLIPRSLKWRAILLTLIGLAGVGGTAGYVWWRPIRSYVDNQLRILREQDSTHPVTRGLARGEIRAGSSLNELIAAHPPKRVQRFGRFTDVDYKDGPSLIALDGNLLFARLGSCSRATIFFNHLSSALEGEYSSSYSAEFDRQIEETLLSHGSVGGLMGFVEYHGRFRELAHPRPYPEEQWETEAADPHRAVGGVTAYMPYSNRFRNVASGLENEPQPTGN